MAEKSKKEIGELQKKSEKDLLQLLGEKREGARHFRFGTAGSATRDVRAVRNNRREIAQILTELNARNRRTADEALAKNEPAA
jgi:ribosomal protein L29